MDAKTPNNQTAVIVAAGQFQEDIPANLNDAQGPVYMATQAVGAALKDIDGAEIDNKGGAQALLGDIDTVFCVRTFGDSGPLFSCPFETTKNMPAAIAKAVGITARRHVYDVIGGNTPQSLIAEAAEEIEFGASKAVLICGGEAIGNMKAAMRAKLEFDWSDDISPDTSLEDRGYYTPKSPQLISQAAEQHEIYSPMQYYTFLENALRAKKGLPREDYRRSMADIMGGLLETSRDNSLSVFSDIDADLNKDSAANPLFTDLYRKSILPKDGVNQGAAIIMTSYGRAVELGFDPRRFIYLHAHVEGSEPPVLQRPELDKSPVLQACISQALAAANIEAKDIGLRDLYSCFPIVLEQSTQALGLNPKKDKLTLTGGLAFFGGPGNNYSLHGLVEMVAALRKTPDDYGLIQANGGFMSKHAVGIYSAKPANFPARIMRHMAENGAVLDMADSVEGVGVIESFCVNYRKGVPDSAVIIGRIDGGRTNDDKGKRFYANPDASQNAALLNWLIEADPFGEKVTLSNDGQRNYFTR